MHKTSFSLPPVLSFTPAESCSVAKKAAGSAVRKGRLGEQGPSSSECLLWLSYFLISLLRRYFPFVLNVTRELLAAARLLVGSAAPVKWVRSSGRAWPGQARVQQGCAAAALTQITSRILKINQLIKISASVLSYVSFPYCKRKVEEKVRNVKTGRQLFGKRQVIK